MTQRCRESRRGPFPAVCALALVAAAVQPAVSQTTAPGDAPPPVPAHAEGLTDCSDCHTCDQPTAAEPCLRVCMRPREPEAARELPSKHGPDVVILDQLEDRFLPVPFDHKGHAAMAGMTGGCAVCHHYTPTCRSCHEKSQAREDMRKPALKGAYHRQCLSCHREWSDNTKCTVCHAYKRGQEGNGQDKLPTVSDILGTMHPPIPEPDTEIYQTRSKPAPGTQVIFRHREHIHRFGLKCVECHSEDNCGRCHEEGSKHEQRPRTIEQHHQPCDRCHAPDVAEGGRCHRCHWKEGEAKPERFSHANVGWALEPYHHGRNCRACHQSVPFTKLPRDCSGCHGEWNPDTFDHAITGQRLDEQHAEIDCAQCHADRKFDQAPACDECHDPEDGVTFPARRPGPTVERQKVESPGAVGP